MYENQRLIYACLNINLKHMEEHHHTSLYSLILSNEKFHWNARGVLTTTNFALLKA